MRLPSVRSSESDENRSLSGRNCAVVKATSDQVAAEIHAERVIRHELLLYGLQSGAGGIRWDLIPR